MPREIYLVKVGMTMTEGMVAQWYIADGDTVNQGEMLYALETEKVNLDVDAEVSGIVKHQVESGVMLEPGDIVGYVFESGEKIPDEMQATSAEVEHEAKAISQARIESSQGPAQEKPEMAIGSVKSSPAARRLARENGIDLTQVQGTGPGGRIIGADVVAAKSKGVDAPAREVKASPLARRLAAERGIDLGSIKGSGPGGRVTKADLDTVVTDSSSSGGSVSRTKMGVVPGDTVPVQGMRRTIAQRMHASLQSSAQLSMDMEAIMDDAFKLREQLVAEWESEGIRPSYTDLVVKAAAVALLKHPRMNSIFTEKEITLLREYHIGIAVALPEGLVVPVIRHADKLTLKEIAIESKRLATAAKEGSPGLDDYAGGTFTISTLGMFGVDSFTPIINEPQSGILGVNRIFDGVEWDGDRPIKTKKMNLSLTWDHRVLDGAPAAEFLSEVTSLLSAPYRLLV